MSTLSPAVTVAPTEFRVRDRTIGRVGRQTFVSQGARFHQAAPSRIGASYAAIIRTADEILEEAHFVLTPA